MTPASSAATSFGTVITSCTESSVSVAGYGAVVRAERSRRSAATAAASIAVGVLDSDDWAANTDNLAVVEPARRRLTWVPRDLWCESVGDRVNRAFATGGHGLLVEALAEHGFGCLRLARSPPRRYRAIPQRARVHCARAAAAGVPVPADPDHAGPGRREDGPLRAPPRGWRVNGSTNGSAHARSRPGRVPTSTASRGSRSHSASSSGSGFRLRRCWPTPASST